jgi:hypothetical protein
MMVMMIMNFLVSQVNLEYRDGILINHTQPHDDNKCARDDDDDDDDVFQSPLYKYKQAFPIANLFDISPRQTGFYDALSAWLWGNGKLINMNNINKF